MSAETPSGTMAGYRRHLHAGEEPCPDSRAATNAWRRAYRRRKREAVTP